MILQCQQKHRPLLTALQQLIRDISINQRLSHMLKNKAAMFRKLTRLLECLEWQEFPQNAE